jgi:transposase
MPKLHLQRNYSVNQLNYQLSLPLNIEQRIPDNDPVRLLSLYVENMDLEALYQTYSRIRKNQASPRQMLKILIYAYMNRLYTSREIETACRRDINFMYLLEGAPAPDHTTIARFRALHLSQCSKQIMTQNTLLLRDLGEISGESVFIDGTKIEAAANKYTFVWKKATGRNLQKRLHKVGDLLSFCMENYGINAAPDGKVSLHRLKKLRKKLYRIKEEEDICFVHGIGKRKTELQRIIEELDTTIDKLKEYYHKIYLCRDRNSYSKTDHDATFMRMKEDAMRNGQLKPAYNLQHAVDSDYIVWAAISPRPTDTRTLIPTLTDMQKNLGFKYENIVADAGYESEENYLFLEKNGQRSFIKPNNYEISRTRKFKTDISRRENMTYDADHDMYICFNHRRLVKTGERHVKHQSGYVSTTTIYTCEGCDGCPFKTKCIHGNNCTVPMEKRNKTLHVSKVLEEKRKEDLERILSQEGCELRLNRTIQAEGSFAVTKEDMHYRRYLCRGKSNVFTESILVAIAYDINKLHQKIQSGRTGRHLHPLSGTA